jgi:hypothetical protein
MFSETVSGGVHLLSSLPVIWPYIIHQLLANMPFCHFHCSYSTHTHTHTHIYIYYTKLCFFFMQLMMNVPLLPRLKEGQQISQSDRIKIVKEKETYSLTIEKARLEDTGSYSVSINLRECAMYISVTCYFCTQLAGDCRSAVHICAVTLIGGQVSNIFAK